MNISTMENNIPKDWKAKWEIIRLKGRFRFAITKALFVAAIITMLALVFVYLTDYKLKVSRTEFLLVLFIVMFFYKSAKNYFIDWPRNEKRYNQDSK